MGVSTVSGGIQSKEQFTEEDFTPKVRKPYTISKQRERWTEDEHKKFLEALKLHGRAWRKIEEHVGTKTAVQIRSHAQKYFSKVVRECNTNDSVSSAKPIEIPPPRPKRKPMHPYPRKLVSPVKGGFLVHEEQSKSASVNLSTLEQENQSPKSVLSAVGSDASAGAESGIHNGSPSPVSSAPSPGAGHECEDSSPDGQLLLGLNLLSDKNSCNKGDSKESGVSCFKLFGQTLSVEDPQKACKPESFDTNEETCFFPRRVVPIRIPASLGCIETSDKFPVTLPWLTLCGGASLSTLEVHNRTVIRPRPSCDNKEILDSHEQREGSSSGSSPDLVSSSATTEKNGDINSCDLSLKRKEKVEVSFSSFKLSKRNSASSVDSRRGFVPYKRCLVEMASNVSSTETCEAREKQRIRLC